MDFKGLMKKVFDAFNGGGRGLPKVRVVWGMADRYLGEAPMFKWAEDCRASFDCMRTAGHMPHAVRPPAAGRQPRLRPSDPRSVVCRPECHPVKQPPLQPSWFLVCGGAWRRGRRAHVKHESLFRPRSTVYYSRKCLKPISDHVPRF